MPKTPVLAACTLLITASLAFVSFLNPSSVLAGTGVLQFDASLQNVPREGGDAYSVSWLPAGTEVWVTDEATDGYYPVTVGVLTGWIRADALVLEAPASPGTISPGAATPVVSMDAPSQALPYVVEPVPPLDPNSPTVSVPDPGPVGPAEVMADAAIYAGPGPDFGVLGTAAPGQVVEQTGHAVSGFVTVRFVGVTGWVSLDQLGPLPDPANS